MHLVKNIFFNKAPLHDGALVVVDGKIEAAGCLLPLSRRMDVDSNLGTRHRAALGISEESDCIAIVVSEETGKISMATNILCYGMSNFAMRESVGLFEDVFDKSLSFGTRYGNALSISPQAVVLTGMITVPTSVVNGMLEHISYRLQSTKKSSPKSNLQLAY